MTPPVGPDLPRLRRGDVIYGDIVERIASGALGEGDKLETEYELSKRYGVSRPVVREALMRLRADGIVMARQGAGTYVQRRPPARLVHLARPADIAGILRCFELRIVLEGEAARLAAMRRTEQELGSVRRRRDAMAKAFARGDFGAGHDWAFHRSVAAASANEFLLGVLDTLEASVREQMAVTLGLTKEMSAERARRVLEEHDRIVEAVAEGDPQGAELAMRFHIDQARKRLTNQKRVT